MARRARKKSLPEDILGCGWVVGVLLMALGEDRSTVKR